MIIKSEICVDGCLTFECIISEESLPTERFELEEKNSFQMKAKYY
jgi:hypothetical protein